MTLNKGILFVFFSVPLCAQQIDYGTQVKNKPVDSIKQYGAKGDGATNDAAAIAAAFASGKSLHFPSGTYRLVNNFSTIPLYGIAGAMIVSNYGGRVTFDADAKIVCTDTTKGCLAFQGGSAVFENLTVDYAEQPADGASDVNLPATITFARQVGSIIKNLRVIRAAGIGVMMYQNVNTTLSGFRSEWSSRDALQVLNCRSIAISDAVVTQSGDDGIGLHNKADTIGALSGTVNTSGSTVTRVSGDTFGDAWVGDSITINNKTYRITGVNSSTELLVAPAPGTQSGVSFSTDGYTTSGTLTNVVIRDSRSSGIGIDGGSKVSVSNVEIDNTFGFGVYIMSNATYGSAVPSQISLSNLTLTRIGYNELNSFTGGSPTPPPYKDALFIQDASNVTVTGATIKDVKGSGVYVLRSAQQVDNIVLSGLSIDNVGTDSTLNGRGIYVYNNSTDTYLNDIKVSNCRISRAYRDGLYVDHAVNVHLSDIAVRNTWTSGTTLDGVANSAFRVNAVNRYSIQGIHIVDDQVTPTGYGFFEYASTDGHISGVTGNVPNGSFGMLLSNWKAFYSALYSVEFVDLAAAANGSLVYCSDCTKATPCAASGTGAVAKRINGAWDCN